MQRVCKCHGMSGSCSVRVCWRRLPSFRQVGDLLSARFEGATEVRMVDKRRKRVKKLRAASKGLKQPNSTELVYLEESPDYCERNETLGILGTHGRVSSFLGDWFENSHFRPDLDIRLDDLIVDFKGFKGE